MPNLAAVIKEEVARLARKEVRSQTDALKKTIASQRSDIAALKRRLQDLEKSVKRAWRATEKVVASPAVGTEAEAGGAQFRFRAKGMASNRKRLGLSAADFGLLVGATGQSVYAWENGKTKPQAKNLASIAALRGMGKREVNAKLEDLKRLQG